MSNSTNIIEIFSSIQGEGPYIGYRHLFVRFALCNLDCEYCDTSFKPAEFCNAEICPGSGSFSKIKNPISAEQLIYKINELTYFPHQALSLTGGEPLLNTEFLSNFLPQYKRQKEDKDIKIYLETNGTLPDKLERIINDIDIVSMDIKLESSTNKTTPWDLHREFIKVAQKNKKDIFAKIVVTDKITPDEIAKITDLIVLLDFEIPVILQPITSKNKELVPSSNKLFNLQEALSRTLADVRIIPQIHKYLEIL